MPFCFLLPIFLYSSRFFACVWYRTRIRSWTLLSFECPSSLVRDHGLSSLSLSLSFGYNKCLCNFFHYFILVCRFFIAVVLGKVSQMRNWSLLILRLNLRKSRYLFLFRKSPRKKLRKSNMNVKVSENMRLKLLLYESWRRERRFFTMSWLEKFWNSSSYSGRSQDSSRNVLRIWLVVVFFDETRRIVRFDQRGFFSWCLSLRAWRTPFCFFFQTSVRGHVFVVMNIWVLCLFFSNAFFYFFFSSYRCFTMLLDLTFLSFLWLELHQPVPLEFSSFFLLVLTIFSLA